MTAIKTYGLPKNANQQEINEVIVKSENLVNVSSEDQESINRWFLKRQNISPDLLPD